MAVFADFLNDFVSSSMPMMNMKKINPSWLRCCSMLTEFSGKITVEIWGARIAQQGRSQQQTGNNFTDYHGLTDQLEKVTH